MPRRPTKPNGSRKRTPSSRSAAAVAVTRVAIIGGGKGGTALIEIFADDPLVRVVGLAETRLGTRGIRLAQRLNIPVTKDYRDFLQSKDVELVIDVTGNPDVEKALSKIHAPNLSIIGGASAKFMWQLVEARIRATTEIETTLMRYQSLFQLYVKEESEGAVNDERTRIACEIHDGLVQTLVGSNLKLERCRDLVRTEPVKCLTMINQTKGQLKDAIQEARQVVYNLRPGHYDNLDLVSALSNYLKSFEAEQKIRTAFKSTGAQSHLDPKTKVFVFRMVQEALHNVAKHAKASQVHVEVMSQKKFLVTTITDNGTGFDVAMESNNPEKWDHFGLQGMMERARMLAGEVRWESQRGKGTSVTIHIPIASKEKRAHG
ncbi:histidine kinase [Nitrospira sp. M1]